MDWKRCYKFKHEVVDNLRVSYNMKQNMLAFWNKYQIFLLSEKELDAPNWPLAVHNTFEMYQVILADFLLCLDYKGTLLAHSFNIQQSTTPPKRHKSDFQHLENHIVCMKWYKNILFVIQFESTELYLKCNKIILNDRGYIESKTQSKYKIYGNFFQTPNDINMEKCMLYCYKINESVYNGIKHIFRERKHYSSPLFMVIMSFDKTTLYIVLVDGTGETLTPIKIFTSPSEINNVDIEENAIIVSLTSGTLIKQGLNKNCNIPNITHFNTAIHKLTVLNEKIIYTDGHTMWVSTNTFSEPDVKVRQLFVRNAKDFTHIGKAGQIICTTYSNFVYIFNVNDEPCYLPVTDSEYYPAEHLLNNMDYLVKIMKEVENNDKIINLIKKEENYITSLALSNRQDIINEMIQSSINVYENYQDILKEGLLLNLTNELEEYFDRNSFCFLIRMSTLIQQNYGDILANIFTDCKIHITILSEQQIIKTICLEVLDQLKNFNIVVPLKITKTNVTGLFFNIKIVKKIPKVLNCKDNLWTALYNKQFYITPEHFITTNRTSDNVRLLKEPEDSIENLLYKITYKHYGHLFRITKVSEDLWKWSFYIKLPNKYKEFLQNETFYREWFNATKAKFLLKEISSEEFLNLRKIISFLVVNDRVDIEIINDGFSNSLSSKMIKVSSVNPVLSLGIRNFLSNLAHNNYQIYQPGQEYINCSRYISLLEKAENDLKKCLSDSVPFEEFIKIYEQFQIYLSQILV